MIARWVAAPVVLSCMVAWEGDYAHAQLQDPEPLYEISLEDLPDLRDGSLDDWRGLFDVPTITETDMVFDPKSDSDQPEGSLGLPDLAVECYLAWNSATDRIYLGLEVRDDVYRNGWDRTGYPRDTDYAVVEVDGDDSGGEFIFRQFFDCEGTPASNWDQGLYSCHVHLFFSMLQAQQYALINTGTMGAELTMFGHRQWLWDYPLLDAGGAVHLEQAPARYTLEASITPFDNLDWRGLEHSSVSSLGAGKVVRIALSVFDDDVEGEWGDWYTTRIEPSMAGYRYSDNWPRYRLAAAPPSTTVRDVNWSQVKQSGIRGNW